MSILGFTGTRHGMMQPQIDALINYIRWFKPTHVVHGGAIGADEEFAIIIQREFPLCTTEVFPAYLDRLSHWNGSNILHDVKPPLHRNKLIVARCDHLLAAPEQRHEVQRSGTWATIRQARRMSKSYTIIWPDGVIRLEEPPYE